MFVIKRNGEKESVKFDAITERISQLCFGLKNVDPILIAKETINSMFNGITTCDLDILSANKCSDKIHQFPDYNKLGGRILADNLSKKTSDNYFTVVEKLYNYGLLSDIFFSFVEKNHGKLQTFLDYSRDYLFDYFAIRTLLRSYLFKIEDEIIERPQHLWMRVAIQIHGCNINNEYQENDEYILDRIKETYDLLSLLYFTHATPTLFNSGTKKTQLSSCFLYSSDDNIEDIFKTISDTAKISKWAGGIGLSLSNIRVKGTLIKGTNGKSDGIIPLCKTIEMVGRYINQGGKRQGSIAVYLEPWHADIYDFVELRKNTGDENLRARDLFLALWIPDLFMKRVQEDEKWSLFCPHECPGLVDSYGDEFEKLYISYEKDNKYKKQVSARNLWDHIISNQVLAGMPYISFKDNVNRKNMQSHIGVIRNSNLCNEITLVSDKNNYAVCNLASICLSKFVEDGVFNFGKLIEVAGIITRNLDNLIDVNYYPVPETQRTNMDNRPIGIGVQGLADVYCMLKLPFASDEARKLNKRIFEAIYYGSVKMSIKLASERGTYKTYDNSPHYNGKLQFDFWDNAELTLDWNEIKKDMSIYGMRNSLLTALMPTASTSQIMGNNECFEPFTSNIYVRKTMAGEFNVVNKYLIDDLIDLGLWNKEMYEELVYEDGSVQNIQRIPQHIKELYKTAYELKVTDILKQSIDRSPFIDHTQSMNLYISSPTTQVIGSSHFYAWKNGLKTGMYYLHTKINTNATKFGIDPDVINRILSQRNENEEAPTRPLAIITNTRLSCPLDPALRETCMACSS